MVTRIILNSNTNENHCCYSVNAIKRRLTIAAGGRFDQEQQRVEIPGLFFI
jgi:hypothetical protein